MTKHFKKSLAVFLVFIFIISVFSINSSAINDGKLVATDDKVINEWEEYKKIISMTDKELAEVGYTKEDIAKIRSFDYETEIRCRAKLDDETLKIYGYTDDDIIKLRRAAAMDDIPENVVKSISTATMSSTLKYKSNGSRTEAGKPMYYVNMEYSWEWNRIPFFRLIDMVVVGYASKTADEYTYCVQSNNKVQANLIAVNSLYSNISQAEAWVYSTDKPNSISAKFAVALNDENGALTHFAYSGKGTFQLINRSNNAMLYVDACYGHTTINIVPNYSINLTGFDTAIDFRAGMDEQHCAGVFYENFTIGVNQIYHGTIYGKNNTGGTAP